MNPVLVLPLALGAAVAFGGWKYTKHPRLIAAGALMVAFFTALGIPSLAGAIGGLVIGSVTGMAILLFLDVYCLYVFGHEVWTGEHHEPVRTPVFCMIGGFTLAATFVAWPEIKAQITPTHLVPAVWHAILAAATTARQAALTHSLPASQEKGVVIKVVLALAVVAYLMYRHNKHRLRVSADPAVAMVDRANDGVKAAQGALKSAHGWREKRYARQQVKDAKAARRDVQLQARQARARVQTVKPLPKSLTVSGWRGAGRKARAIGGKRKPDADFQPARNAIPQGQQGPGGPPFDQYRQLTGKQPGPRRNR